MCKDFTTEIRTVYNLLADETSKEVFANRLLFNLTGDNKFLRGVISTIKGGEAICHSLLNSSNPRAIFGAGEIGKRIKKHLIMLNLSVL